MNIVHLSHLASYFLDLVVYLGKLLLIDPAVLTHQLFVVVFHYLVLPVESLDVLQYILEPLDLHVCYLCLFLCCWNLNVGLGVRVCLVE